MSNLLTYSGINTKVRAMESNLISIDDFYKISILDKVSDLILFLKNHPGYKEIFSRYDEHELHRSDAEQLFVNALYHDFTKIYRFADKAQRKDLELIFFRYEVNILKSCIRMIYNDQDNYDLSIFYPFFSKHSKININTLAACHTIEEYINNLKGTEYHSLLMRIQNSGHATSFDYEMQLDIYYFKKTWKLKDKFLSGDSLKSFTDRLGTEIDLLNILWIFRAKTMYDMPSANILSFVIPVNYKLPKDNLLRLINAASHDEFFLIVRQSHYRSFAVSLQDATMESAYRSIVNRIYRRNRERYPYSTATVNHYLYQKDTEVARLTTAVECIRYRLDPQLKLKYILS
ncbi:MAG: H+transporting two-sector ATPase subunit [Herbinix sp.]|jgi:V/A-type H+-transporting ATPase subunit C|nr:H+transporting two-sector ATPase subunit [Herbinix sp.]